MVGTPRCGVRGQRSALSLPRLGDENVRPILRSLDKACTNWICEDVVSLFTKTFFFAQPMFKKVALRFDVQSFRSPFLPLTDNCLNSLFSFWKREQGGTWSGISITRRAYQIRCAFLYLTVSKM